MGAVAEDIHADNTLVRPAYGTDQIPCPEQALELVKLLQKNPAPILRNTINSLLEFQDRPNASIPRIVDILRFDPGYSQYLFSIVNEKLEDVHKDRVNSLQQAILVLGIPQVLAIGHELPVLEDLDDSHVKVQIYRCFSRSYHAGVQAREWLRARGKTTSEAAFFSAQLRDTYLASLWFYASDKMSELLKTNNLPTLCFPAGLLNYVGKDLAKNNHLPALQQQSYTPETADSQLSKTIAFACAVSQLAENGWNSKQMSELVEQAELLVGQSPDSVHKQLHRHAVIAAKESTCYPVRPVAVQLVELEKPKTAAITKPKLKKRASIDGPFNAHLTALLNMGKTKTPQKILKYSFNILEEIITDKPIAFLLLDKARNRLKSRSTAGFSDNQTILIPIDKQNIFKRLMTKQQSVLINQDNRKGFAKLLPGNLKVDIKNRDFVAMSLFVNSKPVGLFYAELDGANPASIELYKKVIALCKTTRASMEEVQKYVKT